MKIISKTAQEIQDDIFSRMPAEKKIKMVSNFFEFGKKLNKLGRQNGNRRAFNKNSRNFREN